MSALAFKVWIWKYSTLKLIKGWTFFKFRNFKFPYALQKKAPILCVVIGYKYTNNLSWQSNTKCSAYLELENARLDIFLKNVKSVKYINSMVITESHSFVVLGFLGQFWNRTATSSPESTSFLAFLLLQKDALRTTLTGKISLPEV